MSDEKAQSAPSSKSTSTSNSPLAAKSVEVTIKSTIDASGLTCPLPLLKAKQGLKTLASGECLRVIATDAGSVRDFNAFAELSGNQLVAFEESDNRYIYVLKKA